MISNKCISIPLVSLVLLSCFASADQVRIRLREQYEWSDVEYRGENLDYRGWSNTANIWMEDPFHFSYGLAVGSVLSSFSSTKTPQSGIGDRIKINFAGLEAKYFPMKDRGLFTRLGGYWNHFDLRGSIGSRDGWSYYGGAGWEFLLWNAVGLAPEFGVRQAAAQGLFMTTYRVSLGVHFYKFH
ncbi:MAG: hypothetical protein AB7F86_13875 [Bdellovibrionales bacterium]